MSISPIAQVKKPRCSSLHQRFLTCTLEEISCAICTSYFSTVPKPYQKRWLADTFRRLWAASNPEKCHVKVFVYLLRHRYATAVYAKWLDEGVDLNARLPYLSAYMGHAGVEDTAYYIHLLPERLLSSARIDWERLNAMIPEVEDEG